MWEVFQFGRALVGLPCICQCKPHPAFLCPRSFLEILRTGPLDSSEGYLLIMRSISMLFAAGLAGLLVEPKDLEDMLLLLEVLDWKGMELFCRRRRVSQSYSMRSDTSKWPLLTQVGWYGLVEFDKKKRAFNG